MSKKQRETNRTARAAAVRREQANKERRRRILITAVVLAVLAVIVTAGVVLGGRDNTPSSGGTSKLVHAEVPAIAVGTDSKATKVVVWEDFLCPFCREFEASSRKVLRDAAAKGDAYVEYRPFHLVQDDYSTLSLTAWAAVLQKGTPTQALKLHDLLFENQPYESATDKPTIDEIVAFAKKVGVKDEAVLAAMREPDQKFVDSAGAAAAEARIDSTPTVTVDGKELTGTVSQMVVQLQQQLAK